MIDECAACGLKTDVLRADPRLDSLPIPPMICDGCMAEVIAEIAAGNDWLDNALAR